MSDSYAVPEGGGRPADALAVFGFYDGLEEHATLVAGDWPSSGGAGVVEAALPAPAAEALGLAPGDEIALAAIGDPTRKVDVRLTGTYRVDDPRDPFWWGHRLETGGERTIDFTTYGPFVVTEDAFAPVAGAEANLAWRAALSPSRITVASLPGLREDVSALQRASERGRVAGGVGRHRARRRARPHRPPADGHALRGADPLRAARHPRRRGAPLPRRAPVGEAGARVGDHALPGSGRGGRRGACGDGGSAARRARGDPRALGRRLRLTGVEPCGPAGADRPRARSPRDDDVLCPRGPRRPALRRGARPSRAPVGGGDVHRGRARAAAAEELRPARRPRPDSRRGRPHRVLAAPPLRRARGGERSGEARHRPAAHRGTRARPPRRGGSRAACRSRRGLAGRAGRELGAGDGGRARDAGAGAPAAAVRALGSPSDARARDRPLRLRLQPHLARVPARPGRLRSRRGRAGRAERALGVDPRAPASGCLREPERRALRASRLPRVARPVGFVRARDPARDRRGSDGRGGQLSRRPGEPPARRDARSPRREPAASRPGPASRPAHAARARRRRGGRPSARGPRILRDRCAPFALRRDQGRRRPPLPPAHDRLRSLGREEAHRLRPLGAARRGAALSTLARRSGDERDPVLPRRTGLYRSTCTRWRWATGPAPSRGSTRRSSPGR